MTTLTPEITFDAIKDSENPVLLAEAAAKETSEVVVAPASVSGETTSAKVETAPLDGSGSENPASGSVENPAAAPAPGASGSVENPAAAPAPGASGMSKNQLFIKSLGDGTYKIVDNATDKNVYTMTRKDATQCFAVLNAPTTTGGRGSTRKNKRRKRGFKSRAKRS